MCIRDSDYTIFCFWNSILHETDEFVQLILDTQITMDEWHKQKAVRNELDTHSSLEIGFSTFFLNRTNRSGIIDKAGPIGGLSQQGDYPIDCRFNKVRPVSYTHLDVYKRQLLMQKKKRTALEATIDVVGRDQQDQILYLKKDPETQIWKLERMETEPHREPPDPVLEAVARLVNVGQPCLLYTSRCV